MSAQRPPYKPAYRLSSWGFRLSFVCSWVAAFIILIGGVYGSDAQRAGAAAMAPIYLPAMVLIILGVLGIHRVTGAADLRAIVGQSGQTRDEAADHPTTAGER